ncbi:hypothetical protein BGW80DRAFT_1289677, partial [Lactifluus volemus]
MRPSTKPRSQQVHHGVLLVVFGSAITRIPRSLIGFRHCHGLTGMKATFPSIIDGDLLQIIHLSNGF